MTDQNTPTGCQDPSCPDFGDPTFGEATCPAEHAEPTGPAAPALHPLIIAGKEAADRSLATVTPVATNTLHVGGRDITQRLYRLPNGYGASVVDRADGALELAVIRWDGDQYTALSDGELDGDLTVDVHPGLTEAQVRRLLARIADLPAVDAQAATR